MNYQGDALLAHAKGGCYRCGRGDSLIDTDAIIEGEGLLALCKGCVLEAAEAAGLHLNGAAVSEERAAFQEERRTFSPEAVEELRTKLEENRTALERCQVSNAALQDALTRVGRERKAAK